MKRLARYFIENSFLVNMISAFMIIVGLVSLSHMKRDLVPQWSTKTISINTGLTGATPTQMERFVTYPIEQAIKGNVGIDSIESTSSQGRTSIRVNVKNSLEDREIEELVTNLKDSINTLGSSMPDDLDEIEVKRIKKRDSWFSSYALSGFDESNDTHQLWFTKFKERIGRIDGITRISDSVHRKQIYIKLNPKQLARFRLNTSDIYQRVNNAFRLYTIGSIQKGSQDYMVEVQNDSIDLQSIGNILIKVNSSGYKLRLKEIATIEYKLPKRNSQRYTNGISSVSFWVFKNNDKDTITLKEEVETFLDKEKSQLPKGVELVVTGDGPSYIERQINALKSNSILGLFLVVVALMLFLGVKNSLMTSFGLPLSYCFTFFILESMGLKIDLISVVGMLLVLGILVDDAIVIGEQYSQNLEAGNSPKEAAANAVSKTWIPITGSVTTTMVAFAPLLLGGDGLSDFLWAIPIVVIASLGVSLFECFFILPNHLAHFVKVPKKEGATPVMDKFRAFYRSSLEMALKLRYLILPLLLVFMGYSIWFANKKIPMNFNLNISSEKVRFLAVLKESNSIEETEKKIAPLWKKLDTLDKKRFDFINTVIGSAWINGEEKKGPQYVSFKITFSQLDDNIEANKAFVEKELNQFLDELKGSDIYQKLEVSRRFDGNNEAKKDIVEINIASSTPFDINKIEKDAKRKLKKVKGVKSVDFKGTKRLDTWSFVPDKQKVFEHGLTLAELSLQIRGYVNKTNIYEYKAGPEILRVYTYIEDGDAQTLQSLKEKLIILPNGNTTPITNLGSWKKIQRESSIHHKDLKRDITIEVSFDEKVIKKEAMIKELKKYEASLAALMPTLDLKTQDADEQSRKNKQSIGKSVIYALLAIFFVLAVILRSLVQPLLICSAIPFGVIGVIWAFYFQGLKLDVMAFIGLIGMAGVVVNDSLLLVDTINKIKYKSLLSYKNIEETIIAGASSRLRAIILTSVTTLGGVFPMAYGLGGDSGFTKPLAMSMGWGLLFATMLTLLVLPCMLMIQIDLINLFHRITRHRFYSHEEIERKIKHHQHGDKAVNIPSNNKPSGEQVIH